MRDIIRDRFLIKILLFGIFIRMLIMPFLFHPDIKTYSFQSSFLKRGVVDIYSYLENNKDNLTLKENFVYFPLTYLTLGGWQLLISPITGSSLDTWLSNAGGGISNLPIYKFLFLLKLPYLLLDVAVAFLLTEFFAEREKKKKVFVFWILNPLSIIITYVFSNVDLFPVLFTLLSLLFLRKNKILAAASFLAIASLYKAYPIILFPLFIISLKNYKEKIFSGAAFFFVMLIGLIPFISRSFMEASLSSGLINRILEAKVSMGYGENIYVGVLFVFVLIAMFYTKILKMELYQSWLLVLLIMYSTMHFHIQWLMWSLPFLTLSIVEKQKVASFSIITFLVLFLIPFLINDKYMAFSIFNMISNIFDNLPSFYGVVSKVYDPNILQSLLHTLGLSMTVVLVFLYSQLNHEK